MQKSTKILLGIGAAGIVAYLLLKKKKTQTPVKTVSKGSATQGGTAGTQTGGGAVNSGVQTEVSPKSQLPLLFDMGSGGTPPVSSPEADIYPLPPIKVEEPIYIDPILSPPYLSPYFSQPVLIDQSTYYDTSGIWYGEGTKPLGDRLMINQIV